MKYYIVYKTTNLLNNKIYIGRHTTDNLNDNYIGSGTEFQKAIKEFGRENFKKEILFIFDNWKEMVDKETELLTEDFVNSDNNYNSTRQGKGLITHSEEVRERLRQINTGLVSVKDKDGNNLKVKVDDPRYLSGELKHNVFGTVCVFNSDGKKFRVPLDDPRYLSGELLSITTGRKRKPEVIEQCSKKMKEYWQVNIHSEHAIEKMREVNIGRVNVIDSNGNEFRVSTNDPRYLSGELVNATKGSIWIHNKDLQKSKFVRPKKVQDFLNDGWELGLVYFNKKTIRITNPELRENIRIPPTELKRYCENGWILGYQYYATKRNV